MLHSLCSQFCNWLKSCRSTHCLEWSGDVEVVVVCLFEGTALCAQFLVSATRHRSHFSVDIPTICCKRSIGFEQSQWKAPTRALLLVESGKQKLTYLDIYFETSRMFVWSSIAHTAPHKTWSVLMSHCLGLLCLRLFQSSSRHSHHQMPRLGIKIITIGCNKKKHLSLDGCTLRCN